MAEGTPSERDGHGILFWIASTFFAVLVVYLLGFALLILFPSARQAAQAMGLSGGTLEKFYYPIMQFLR